MIEEAKEELEILESQHPNRFEYLKQELKSFISDLLLQQNDSHYQQQRESNFLHSKHPSSGTIITQESSTRKKRKKGILKRQTAKERFGRPDYNDDNKKRRDGAEAAIEKAQACLHKIQEFKISF